VADRQRDGLTTPRPIITIAGPLSGEIDNNGTQLIGLFEIIIGYMYISAASQTEHHIVFSKASVKKI